MLLNEYLSKDEISLCNEIGIKIESREYEIEELYEIEHLISEYINENCMYEEFFEKEKKLDSILDIIMDLENESNEINPMTFEIYEDDHVALSNGKYGVVIDITNDVYTIEVDEKYKTGSIDDDIMIVSSNSIISKV